MITQIDIEKCCLCKACSNKCPANAIEYTKKYKGIYYPSINMKKCIGCNLCDKVCPNINVSETSRISRQHKAFAAMSSDEMIRLRSTSGGVFFEIAKEIIKDSGYVCGTVFDEYFQTKHAITDDLDLVYSMCGSKYVQSDIGLVYRKIKELLSSGYKVMFCGCPCQVAGLNSFLGCSYDNLYLVDLVCHGIPGNEVFQAYLDYRNKNRRQIISISFRNKKYGWHKSSMNIKYGNGEEYIKPITLDAYMKGFLGNVTLKESCYDCKFRNFSSNSDLTLGDFWGAEVEASQIDDNKGLSAVVVHTEKGMRLLEKASINLVEYDLDTVIRHNRNIVQSPEISTMRDEFFQTADNEGYSKAFFNYLEEKKSEKVKRIIKTCARRIYHSVIRRKTLY